MGLGLTVAVLSSGSYMIGAVETNSWLLAIHVLCTVQDIVYIVIFGYIGSAIRGMITGSVLPVWMVTRTMLQKYSELSPSKTGVFLVSSNRR